MRRHPVNGRRVWVTGASSGIGRAVAVELVRRGATVIASARNESPLHHLVEQCGGDRLAAVPCDVSDPVANRRAASEIVGQFGGLDVAVLNAGTCEYVEVDRFDSAVFERTMRSNFLSMVYGIEAVLPLLRQSPAPHLVGMSSTVAYAGLPRAEAYGASKAAIRYLLESLRIDLYRLGITVSVVCPGFVRTPLTDRNDFPMPFRIEAEDAARRIVDGIEAGKAEIHFPKRFSLAFKLLTLLPTRLYLRLCARLVREP
ncbi:MAG: 3-phenylpropionate-dihydrodiol/cinnamic acid-dihydrodiol dehydrogenase [Nitrospirae bacterium]|nr:3-phenylpropionate-dihydrodiol/cinnamic acid-dihydrodiol dehydrogenase [Nitrospirota bacterium]MCK6372216.1 SDR family NAD(P)-dependent oxidoreductase [Gammaproteobacteria bacterium]MEB2338126.1 SDR family NAD(P)-dependent oxidoreductase [Nitrospirales bacterium]QOJ35319.1 MAG: SDR family NAD(P)-dependent oxidoreductase [Nitrospira sp.]